MNLRTVVGSSLSTSPDERICSGRQANKLMYDFEDRYGVARAGTLELERWLTAKPETIRVQNVEDDDDFRGIDVDLLWHVSGRNEPVRLEVKVDTYDGTGNLFLETYSNLEMGTTGCFLYTEADFILYYFARTHRLLVLPMPATRHWFIEHEDDFRVSDTTTALPNGGFYTTRGRLVPISRVLAEVSGVVERFIAPETA